MKKLVIYNHGKDSTPWGEKPLAFADIAKCHDYDFESPDFRQQLNPDERVKHLLTLDLSPYDKVVMIGSSMGAYVATVAAEHLTQVCGLFLLAPAFYLPGYERQEFNPRHPTWVFHGWQDDIVPPEHAWTFCRHYHCRLLMLDTDHRLLSQISLLSDEFERFLTNAMDF
jgi:pimeloyl-ACP methyl ester carboxylesterase